MGTLIINGKLVCAMTYARAMRAYDGGYRAETVKDSPYEICDAFMESIKHVEENIDVIRADRARYRAEMDKLK